MLQENIEPDAAISSFYDTAESDPQRWLTLPADFVPTPKLWVRAVGHKEGRAARCSCWFTDLTWQVGGYAILGATLAVAVHKILCGEMQQRGVMTAETAFDPLPFFDGLAGVVSSIPRSGS